MYPYLLLLPMLILYLIFIGGGLYQILQESVGYIPGLGRYNYSGHYFVEILNQKDFLLNLSYSLYLALTGSFLSMVLGIMTAYFFIRIKETKFKSFVYPMLQLGLMIPYLLVIFLGMILLTKTGLLSRLFYHMGMINDFTLFPTLIFDQLGFGVLWVYIVKGTPFIALFTINSMMRVSQTYGDVAKTLGARDFTILRKIYLPLCGNTILWATIVIFAYDLGSFEVPYLLSPISPLPLSAQLYSMYIQSTIEGLSKAMAMSVVILVSGSLIGSVYAIGLHRLLRGRGR